MPPGLPIIEDDDIFANKKKTTIKKKSEKELLIHCPTIHCPTEELWIKVVKKLLDEGYGWGYRGEKEIFWENWHRYGKESCIHLSEVAPEIGYTSIFYLAEFFPKPILISAKKFLRKNKKKKENRRINIIRAVARLGLFARLIINKIKESLEITMEDKARQILYWYFENFLSKEAGEYLLLDVKKAVLRQKLLNKDELFGLLERHSEERAERATKNPNEILFSQQSCGQNDRITSSFRKAAKNLGVFLYRMLTGKSEHDNLSFHLDGYPPIKNLDLSDALIDIITKLANDKYRIAQALGEDVKNLRVSPNKRN